MCLCTNMMSLLWPILIVVVVVKGGGGNRESLSRADFFFL